jgi:CPA1 family monovalent cation:H+ antiporter
VILNALLFISIAFVLVLIEFKTTYLIIGLFSVLIVLLSRFIIVFLPSLLLPGFTNMNNKEVKLIVWGGLRGGLSIAMVLSLPDSETRQILIIATYTCVVFSILVQGLTIEGVARRFSKK